MALTSRCTMAHTTTRPAALRAVRATPRVVVVKAHAKQPARPTFDAAHRTYLAAGFAAAALLFAQPQALAAPLDALTGSTSSKDVSSTIQKDLEKVDKALAGQKDDAVKQAAIDVKEVVVDQAKALDKKLVDQAPPPRAKGIGAQKPTAEKAEKQAAQGLQAQLAQLKSLLGL